MVDITNKSNSLRKATAQAIVKVSKKETMLAIKNGQVPKGDVFEMSRAAGLLGVKKTPEILPDCHPLPIEYAGVKYELDGLDIKILVTIKTIYKTGVEVEAMHGASIVALNLYDMLKPIDKGVEIHHIKLVEKTGGKTDQKLPKTAIKAAVIVCSDSVSKGLKEDQSGKAVINLIKQWDIQTEVYEVIPDEADHIKTRASTFSSSEIPLVIFVGGTGLSPRDITPEALDEILERRIPGMEESMRAYGQARTPYAMLSRSVAGILGSSLVLGIPGSTKGSQECLHAIFPAALHVLEIVKGGSH